MEKHKKSAKRLFTLWLGSQIFLEIISSIYVTYQRSVNQHDPVTLLIVTLLIMFFYYRPLLSAVCRHAQLAEMRKLYRLARFLLVIVSIWAVLGGFFIFLAILFPNLF